VLITTPFYLGIYEVTREVYAKVMNDPSQSNDLLCPVENVTWKDATAFCEKLSAWDKGYAYRLPTEAEWEYACRAGTTTRFSCGDPWASQTGWFQGNSQGTSHAVGQTQPNAWGLFDMHGNVWEWCADWYDADYYGKSPVDDPTGPATGSYRVSRGGGWSDSASLCRTADHSWLLPGVAPATWASAWPSTRLRRLSHRRTLSDQRSDAAITSPVSHGPRTRDLAPNLTDQGKSHSAVGISHPGSILTQSLPRILRSGHETDAERGCTSPPHPAIKSQLVPCTPDWN
jgi:hypothetical protein